MHACMCVCVRVGVCVCVCVRVSECVCACVCVCTCVCTCVLAFVCVSLHACVCTCTCMCVSMCVRVCVCVCVRTCARAVSLCLRWEEACLVSCCSVSPWHLHHIICPPRRNTAACLHRACPLLRSQPPPCKSYLFKHQKQIKRGLAFHAVPCQHLAGPGIA